MQLSAWYDEREWTHLVARWDLQYDFSVVIAILTLLLMIYQEPQPNSWDWRNLTNVLWIEQPIGVGYTQGNVTISNEEGLAKQFVGFYEQFMKTFDLQNYDIYLSGESYAGYVLVYVINKKTTALTFIRATTSPTSARKSWIEMTALCHSKQFTSTTHSSAMPLHLFKQQHYPTSSTSTTS